MSYEVLARKWRPTQFSELVGQGHVVRALKHALENDRLHHAYLFTGTRGVGKTTVARLLARCLNCEKGVSSTPCGQCDSCQEIATGRFVDLIEIDAASHTGVDSIREVLDNVLYPPVRGRYKVYLIDEVHMLSRQAFNALLITLEEPPPHVKFALATTDPSKIPATILSRCLQFHLRNLNPAAIADHLVFIMEKEGVEAEAEAVKHIAKAAAGAMRDALSLADQAIAFGGGKLLTNQVAEMLGVVDQQLTVSLLQAFADNDVDGLFQLADNYLKNTPDVGALLAALAHLIQQVALMKAVPGMVTERLSGDDSVLYDLASALSVEAVHLYYQAALQGRKDLPVASDESTALHMTLLRMLAFKPLVDPDCQSETAASKQRSQSKRVGLDSEQRASTPKIKSGKMGSETFEKGVAPLPAPETTVATHTAKVKKPAAMSDQAQAPVDSAIFTDENRERQKIAEEEIANDPKVQRLKKEFSASSVRVTARPVTPDT